MDPLAGEAGLEESERWLASVDERIARSRQLAQVMQGLVAQGRSPGGDITVTVNAQGVVQSVQMENSAVRAGGAQVAADLMYAHARAVAQIPAAADAAAAQAGLTGADREKVHEMLRMQQGAGVAPSPLDVPLRREGSSW